MKKSNQNRTIRIHEEALARLKGLELSASHLQGERIGMRELTRRMSKASSFNMLEKEILTDAQIKKQIRGRK